MRFYSKSCSIVVLAIMGAVALAPRAAQAQATTFYLDRLQVPGAPDDGIVMWRPVTQPDNIFYGQLGVGFQYAPLRTDTIVQDPATLRASGPNVIDTLLTIYGSTGFELFNRVILAVNFPWSPLMTGQNPNYPSNFMVANGGKTIVDATGPAADDMRIDLRGVILRTPNLRGALGAGFSIFAPTGSFSRFGGDGQTSFLFEVTAEYDFRPLVLIFNTGVHFNRVTTAINNPVGADGLGVSDDWSWALGAFLPFKDGKYRLGLNIFGQTGIHSDSITTGNTFFRLENTPVEWNVEGRMKFGPSQHWWAGATLGSLVVPGYGAPDFRAFACLGAYVPLPGSTATQSDKERKLALREKWRSEHGEDSDGDGIPDDIDACPMEKGTKDNDGCPKLADRDGDGIPDIYDKCPDQPEDKDGIDDGDGCPETDADGDGIPDTEDACPKSPGPRNADPKKNGCPTTYTFEGTVIKFVQQVHFAIGSATILADSFQILQDAVNLIKVNPQLKRLAVEGHTDNTGSADLNRRLSQQRSESVMNWLVEHGIDKNRLEAHGYGPDKPIDTNDTQEGRTHNRRVEFKILEQSDANQSQKK
jgi:outer membrane protein OmpA-like peptidoglycan-associated protein